MDAVQGPAHYALCAECRLLLMPGQRAFNYRLRSRPHSADRSDPGQDALFQVLAKAFPILVVPQHLSLRRLTPSDIPSQFIDLKFPIFQTSCLD